MTLQLINMGLTGSTSGGDNLSIAITKSNSNFIELYDHVANLDNPHQTTSGQINAISLDLFAQPSGVATLGSDGILTLSQRPPGGLWSPGAPILANWTAVGSISGMTVIQNGTNSAAVTIQDSASQVDVTGWITPVPSTTPYQIVIAAQFLESSNTSGSNNSTVSFGWSDGSDNYFIFDIYNNVLVNILPSQNANSYYYPEVYANLSSTAGTLNSWIYLILADDGTNITFSYTVDGVNGIPIYSTPKTNGPLSDYSYIFLGVGCSFQNSVYSEYGSLNTVYLNQTNYNFFLYDPNGINRIPVAPGN